jgi:hypothetical protein
MSTLASNNPYPSILVDESTVPSSPSAGHQRIYIDSADHKAKRVNSSGAVTFLDSCALLFVPLNNEAPAAAFATADTRNSHKVLDFDGATDEEAVWTGVLPSTYGGNGLTVDTFWSFTAATSGSLRVQAAIERIDLSGLDVDADSFEAFQSAGGTAPGTTGMVIKVSVVFTSGSQMDSLVAGELFRVKIRRDADGTSGTDDIATDAELHAVVVRET